MARDPETLAHLEWLGYVQPVGLVVSVPALLAGGAHVNRNIAPDQQRFIATLPRDKQGETIAEIRDFAEFTCTVLGWDKDDLIPGETLETLEVALPVYNETLRPTFAVKESKPKDPKHPWLLVIQIVPAGTDLDKDQEKDDRHWHASPHARFERLLREAEVPIGLLVNGTHLRLVYAPHSETSGYLTFAVAEMATVAGRPIFAALHMLLCAERLFSLPEKERLPSLLSESRKYQNVVSTQLAEQVMAALFELLRGLQAADDQRNGELLRQVLAQDPNQVYSGLLTVLMRLVFILYAEDRGLLSNDPIYANYYSVTGLFERLRADDGRYPDTMDQRYGGWAQLLTLFRLIHEGGKHAGFQIPARKGYLFDPDRYPFLEGRKVDAAPNVPRVSEGVLFRVLSNLLVLDGERLSYRTLDVEQIGSVYEAIMGFNLEVARGRSIAIKPAKSHGAPATINLEELIAERPAERAKWLAERTDQKLTGQGLDALKKAGSLDELLAALEKKIARQVTPNVVPKGAMIFQPSDERRRSGSHYTPRSLTEPIVRKTLEPILKQLGDKPTPTQLLELKVCDPAMGSGAFLVEACRQLGDVLIKAWHVHNQVPRIPPDEDEILHARRLIAQRCLYGVDKNPMAVDLAKLSLWLATLAKDHPFTFLDHALRNGDSLVGLSKAQIRRFHWQEGVHQMLTGQEILVQHIEAATRARQEIIEAGDEVPFLLKQQKLALADESLNLVRFAGNLVIVAFFSGGNDKQRKAKREELLQQLSEYLRTNNMALRPTKAEQGLLSGDKAIHPFHWEIEFPEVFGRENGGFDSIIGNPPFMGGTIISNTFGMTYFDFLTSAYPPAGHLCDLVAYFFRRAFELMRDRATLGLVATKTVAQGDTRSGGLREILLKSGVIYDATKRYKWPGLAAVVVSLIHLAKRNSPPAHLDGKAVERISSFLFARGGDDSPLALAGRGELWSIGTKIYGAGFLFEDGTEDSTPIEAMREILARHPPSGKIIWPYIGGDELNSEPQQVHSRFVINFNDVPEEAGLDAWPELRDIVQKKVKPGRDALGPNPNNLPLKKRWWAFQGHRPEFYRAARQLKRVLAQSQVSAHLAFAFQPTDRIFANTLNLFLLDSWSAFAILQCRAHENWVRFFGSSLEDRLRYTSSDCFETFPFPDSFETNANLEAVGKDYYEFRAALMVKYNEGLTKTYNRFHDPNETSPDIQRLRELHTAMDRAVLDAYGWTDLHPTCEFLLDYEDEDEDDDTGQSRNKKKPWRYRWPDEFRDEVLARLLELNKKRAEDEKLSGAAHEAKSKKKAARTKGKKDSPGRQSMFP